MTSTPFTISATPIFTSPISTAEQTLRLESTPSVKITKIELSTTVDPTNVPALGGANADLMVAISNAAEQLGRAIDWSTLYSSTRRSQDPAIPNGTTFYVNASLIDPAPVYEDPAEAVPEDYEEADPEEDGPEETTTEDPEPPTEEE